MAADERVGLMEGFDALTGAEGDDFAEAAGIDDGLDGGVEGGVAEDEAEGDAAAERAGEGVEGFAAREGFGGGFLQQHVVAEVECGGGVLEVVGILGGDDEDICELSGGEERLVGIEGADVAVRGEACDGVAAGWDGVGGGGDLVAMAEGCGDL